MAQVITGDALTELRKIPDNSINCCVTSPPYYGLRDYGVESQIGLETTPQEYIDKLVEVFRDVRRVLKSDGTLWLNIGDSYSGSCKVRNDSKTQCKRKDLIGIPWLLAFALRNDGWYLRQDIIWCKPNCMPESVKDRCTRSHEYIFLLSKSEKYYFDSASISEPAVTSDRSSPRGSKGTMTANSGRRKQDNAEIRTYTGFNERYFSNPSPQMRNKRDVWSVSTAGYKGSHFAVFPEKLIEPCILAGCPIDGVVLDPFLGSGTSAVVAENLGRECIGIELNPEYAKIAVQRLERNKINEA